jgi:hypothetical protein
MNYVNDGELCGNIMSVKNFQRLQMIEYKGKQVYYLPASFKKKPFEDLEELKKLILEGKKKNELSEHFNMEPKKLDGLLIRKFKTCVLKKLKEALLQNTTHLNPGQ